MKYFTLKPQGTDPYARASRIAMRHYAAQIEQTNPKLAQDLLRWADMEAAKAMTEAP